MTNKSDRIVEFISLLKPDSIDKEELNRFLSCPWLYDCDGGVLRVLYSKKFISLEEYKKYLADCIHWQENKCKEEKKHLKEAEEKGESYKPFNYQCCCLGNANLSEK